ncbi:MAG: lysylphosphatidylglycerol synthase domain-containing protein [Ktedonobacteraceae bacterium]
MQKASFIKIGKRIVQVGLPLAILGFFTNFIIGQWKQLVAHPFQWNPWLIALAFAGFLLQELSYGLIWQAVLARLGSRLDLRTSLRIYLASEFVRYIPGNVWHVLARILWVGKYGVPRPLAFASMTVELITKLGAGAFIFATSLLFWSSIGTVHALFVGKIFIAVLGILLVLLLLIMLHPRILGGLLNTALRLLKREPIVLSLRYSDILFVTGAWCVSWIIAGSAFYILTLALWPALPLAALPICIGIYAIAWDIGFVSFITPSGLGFREGAIGALFAFALSMLPLALGPIIAILSRVVSTAAEVVCVSIAYLAGRQQIQAMQQEQRIKSTAQIPMEGGVSRE